MSSPAVLGVDGIRDGWVGALLVDGGPVTWSVVADAATLVDAVRRGEVAVAALDIPIGLPSLGPRACDVAARRRLGSASSSVFPAPTQAVLDDHRRGLTYPAAVRRARARGEPAPSRQTWSLLPKVGQVDSVVSPRLQHRVVECHPEVSFRAMDAAVSRPKRSTAGVAERLAALRGWVDPLDALREVPAGVPIADALDALACAWTAQRVAAGHAEPLGDPDQRDSHGHRMIIRV